MDPLYRGAIATAVTAAAGTITALPQFDPEHFSPVTLHGALRLFGFLLWSVVILEARYWKAWADKILGNGKGDTP
jgi:hypothetical protein